MDAGFALKVGLTTLWTLSILVGIATIGQPRKPRTPLTEAIATTIAAVLIVGLWRWL